jgi:hypothetical protein
MRGGVIVGCVFTPNRLPDTRDCPLLGLAEHVFEFGECLFDGIEIGAVGRQEEEAGTRLSNGLADSVVLVAPEFVENDGVSCRQFRHEHLFDVDEEVFAIDRPIKDIGCNDARGRQARDAGLRDPLTMRHVGNASFTHGTPAMKWSHVGLIIGYPKPHSWRQP